MVLHEDFGLHLFDGSWCNLGFDVNERVLLVQHTNRPWYVLLGLVFSKHFKFSIN